MIAIVDYDIGNISAVSNMIRRLGSVAEITGDAQRLAEAEKIILPGNGAFDACMKNLRASGLLSTLEHKVLIDKVPLLGICVGAQMLGMSSDEGVEPGLGWLEMDVRKLPRIPGLPVPHMGWNQTLPGIRKHPLFTDIGEDTRFYFVHSYYMLPKHPEEVLLEVEYGFQFAAAAGKENIVGVQFHPEKSHRFGKQLLSRFLEWR